jgi:hypothetical protein
MKWERESEGGREVEREKETERENDFETEVLDKNDKQRTWDKKAVNERNV